MHAARFRVTPAASSSVGVFSYPWALRGAPLPAAAHTELDLDDLVDTATAAHYAQVTRSAVANWVARGHLQPAGRDYRGRPLYRLRDVARAEHATRAKARRHHH